MAKRNFYGVDFSGTFRFDVPQSLRMEFTEACQATSSVQSHLIREWMREYVAENRETPSYRSTKNAQPISKTLAYPETSRDSKEPFSLFHVRISRRMKSEFSEACKAIRTTHAKIIREWMREYIADNAISVLSGKPLGDPHKTNERRP